MHASVDELGAYLRAVVAGHVRYYGVPLNGPSISVFRLAVGRIWKWVLERRSERTRIPWSKMGDSSTNASHHPASAIPCLSCASASSPNVGSGCGSSARPVLKRTRRATAVPTLLRV